MTDLDSDLGKWVMAGGGGSDSPGVAPKLADPE